MNREHKKTGNTGTRENKSAPDNESIQANIRHFFSPNFWIIIPEGIDIKAYAIKNENGSIPVNVPLKVKLSLTLGLIDPRMFVKNEIAKKIRKIRMTT